MDILKLLNSSTQIINLKNLEIGKLYEIIEAEKVASKYGYTQLKVKIVYDDNIFGMVYLPERYANRVPDKQLKELTGLKMVYKGMKTVNSRDMHDVDFQK